MRRLVASLFATAWCAFWAGVVFESMKYADKPLLTIVALCFIIVGWMTMLQIAKDL